MVSWDVVLGLVLLAFALPFILLSAKIRVTRYRTLSVQQESKYLRLMLRDLENHVRHDQELFLEALGVPFILLRPSGRVEMANKKAMELVGLESALQVNLLRVMPECDLRAFFQQVCASTESIHAVVTAGEGENHRIYRAKATLLDNRKRHFGIVFLDVTEEHRTQVIRRDFVANASHELRTPLTLIMGYLDALIDEPEVAEDTAIRQRSLGIMKRHADRMTRLISDMLMLARVDSPDSGYLNREDFDLNRLAEDVQLRLQPMIDEQKAAVEMDIQSQPFMMTGDSFYWSQVIFNLIENSLKNNPSPGLHVNVKATREADASCTIQVEDNGIGISEEALPYIFNRFYRADASGKVKGTGLGLAIVKNAVEAHGGSIYAESRPGKRTVFRIHLPA